MAWILPWLYHFVTAKPVNYPFTMYSCIAHDFVSADRSSGENVYRDAAGKVYTNSEFDSILPTFYYRQLMADGRLPDSIEGKPVDVRSIQHGNFIFRHSTTDINAVRTPLYFLLEAMSGRVDLKMPEDVFRMTDRMEFVDMETNTVNEEKSGRFTRALLDKGFVFPVRYVAGNPTARKDYDEGYLMIDHDFSVFHVKQLRGRAYVRRVEVPGGVKMKYAFVTEFRNRRFYGFFTDTENRAYVLETGGYQFRQLPLDGFDPETENLTVFGDDFYWTVQVTGVEKVKLYAVRSGDYTLTDRMEWEAKESWSERLAGYIFPFELSFTSYRDKWVYPRFTDFSAWALILNVVLAGVYCFVWRKTACRKWLECSLLLLFGIFALVPVLLFVKRY